MLELAEDLHPELRALGLLKPQAEHVAVAVDADPQREIARAARIELAAYDSAWTEDYRHHAALIRAVLGGPRAAPRARGLHLGAAAAMPVIDIVLEVRDSAAEPASAPDLEAAGYLARLREPDWFEHRLFRDLAGGVNLHVFSVGCPETERMIQFRDWLRSHPERELYAQTRHELTALRWTYMQQYADDKDQRGHLNHGPGPGRPTDHETDASAG